MEDRGWRIEDRRWRIEDGCSKMRIDDSGVGPDVWVVWGV
jgi:hypothetical protein